MRSQSKLLLIGAATVLAGCAVSSDSETSVGRQLGITQGSPDEFLIIARDPIEVPASFTLPRPTPGAPSRVEVDPIADARRALFRRDDEVRLAVASPGEQVLLSGADANSDLSVIRETLENEEEPVGEREFGLTSFLGVEIPAVIGDADAVLDSVDETEALRQRGLPTPAAPPAAVDRNTGIRYIER